MYIVLLLHMAFFVSQIDLNFIIFSSISVQSIQTHKHATWVLRELLPFLLHISGSLVACKLFYCFIWHSMSVNLIKFYNLFIHFCSECPNSQTCHLGAQRIMNISLTQFRLSWLHFCYCLIALYEMLCQSY